MEKIRALIVDDERLSRRRLRRLLAAEPDIEVVAECAQSAEAASHLDSGRVDLLFLDVQMPQMDGFQLLGSLDGARLPAVVFVTAYDEYALKAFEVHALDYLLKPFDRPRFAKTLDHARRQIEYRRSAPTSGAAAAASARTHVAIKTNGKILFLRAEEVDWVEAADNYVRVHVGHDAHLVRETLNAMQTRLDPARFLRIHRSALVNVARIRELRPWFHGDYVVLLTNGRELTLSRSYRDQVLSQVGG